MFVALFVPVLDGAVPSAVKIIALDTFSLFSLATVKTIWSAGDVGSRPWDSGRCTLLPDQGVQQLLGAETFNRSLPVILGDFLVAC